MNLIEARERETKLFAELQNVLDGAEGRQLTPEECEKVEKMNAEADQVQARIRSAQASESAEMRLGSARGGWDMQNTAVAKTAETDFRGFMHGAYGREFRALPITSGASPEAGDTLGLGMYSQFIEIMNRLSPMRQICAVDSFSTSDIRYPVQASQVTVDDDTSEGAAFDNYEPTFGAKTPTPRKFAVTTSVSTEAIDDSAFDLESIISRQQAESLAYAQDQAFLVGEGVANSDDTLFESYASDGGILKTAGNATTLSIQEMVQGLCELAPTGYFGRPGAFVVASGLIDDLLTQDDSVNRPLLQAQAASSFSIESPFQIFGRPVYVTSGGPAMTSGNFCAAYVSQGAARIADVGGLTFLRDPYSSAANGLVNLLASMRSAFSVTEPRGIVSYQLA
ncbi:MAG: phage major capsid protein [bacterium TMED88]|nr:phage major capsid protein [Deltaproteobacteria bacterium]OUV32760.1 MAG: phage major capsid protein [bacterium TMED88]